MEASPLTQQSRPSSFQPKIAHLYDELLKPNEEEITLSDGFWREFFLLKPDKPRLQQTVDNLSPTSLLLLQHETQQLFSRAISDIRTGEAPSDEHALDTLTVFLGVVLSKKYTNPSSDTITVIAGLDEVDSVMSDFANAIEHCIRCGRSFEIRRKAVDVALALTAGAYHTSLVSYFSYRDLFPALMKYIQDSENASTNSNSLVLLGLLANYNKFEFRNPYRSRFEDFVNESIIIQIVRGLSVACVSSRNRYILVQDDVAEGWSLSTALSYIGLGAFAPNKATVGPPPKPEDIKGEFAALPDPNAAVLLAAFDFSAANKVFGYSLVTWTADSKASETPFSAFLSFTSYILHHAYRSSRATVYGLLNLLILRIIIEDLGQCKLLCDQERPVDVRLCRQRQPLLPIISKPRPAAASILDIYIDTINHNLRRNLDLQLYISVVNSIHRFISYLTFTKTRLNYHWPLLWQTLLSFLRFLTNYSSTLTAQGAEMTLLIHPLLAALALAVLSGESFLPSTAAYDDLFYKLVEAGDWLDRFQKAFAGHLAPVQGTDGSANPATGGDGAPRSPIDVLAQVSSHYKRLVEEEKGKGKVGKHPSPREVSKVIKQGYETLSLPGMEGLDRWDRFREGDERTLLKRAARVAVDDARRVLQLRS